MNKRISSTKRQRKMIYFSILGKSIMIMWRKYYLVSRQQMITAHLYTKDKYLQTIKELSIAIICKECGIDLRDYNDKNVKCKPKPSSIIKNGTIIPSHYFVRQRSVS